MEIPPYPPSDEPSATQYAIDVMAERAEGWKDGVRDAIKKIKARQAHYELYRANASDEDLTLARVALRTHPATFAVLDEVLVFLEAMLERGPPNSTDCRSHSDADGGR